MKPYIGRTTQTLAKRMSGHRENFYKVIRNEDVDAFSDDFSLGIHLLHEHGCSDPPDFDIKYNLQILKNVSPRPLEKCEHVFIHKFRTLAPLGLNKTNLFGLTVLDPV